MVVLGLAAFGSSLSSFIPGGAPKGHDAFGRFSEELSSWFGSRNSKRLLNCQLTCNNSCITVTLERPEYRYLNPPSAKRLYHLLISQTSERICAAPTVDSSTLSCSATQEELVYVQQAADVRHQVEALTGRSTKGMAHPWPRTVANMPQDNV